MARGTSISSGQVDEQSATFNICACCGCEFGNEDCLPEGVQRHREKSIANGGTCTGPEGPRVADRVNREGLPVEVAAMAAALTTPDALFTRTGTVTTGPLLSPYRLS